MTRVAVSGAGGRLATPIIEAIAAADDIELAALYNPNRAGEVIAGVAVAATFDVVEADVVLETAHPDVVLDNLDAWCELGVAAVVGTSGFTTERLGLLESQWNSDRPCLVVPNFSIGAVLMMRFAGEASAHFEAVEVVERHGASKPDAPSGTALATAARIAQAGGSSIRRSEELVNGALGADVEGVSVHSLRLPGVIAQQEVVLSNGGEVLTLEHLSTSYQSFVGGALAAIRGVGRLGRGVHVGLDAVI